MSRMLRVLLFVLPWLSCSVSQEPSAGIWNPYAELIFVNGHVVTVDRNFAICEGIAVKDGRIISVGTNDDVMKHFGEETSVIELGGKTVIPGIQDSHIHFLGLGHDVTYQAELTFCKNAEEIVDALRKLKERMQPKPGEWLVGERWDQYKYPKMVTRWDLDPVAFAPISTTEVDPLLSLGLLQEIFVQGAQAPKNTIFS